MMYAYYDLVDKYKLCNNIILLFQISINPYYVLHDIIKSNLTKRCVNYICSNI